MTLRPLGYSLLIHLVLLVLFVISYPRKELRNVSEPLTIHISSLNSPAESAPVIPFSQPTPAILPQHLSKQIPLPAKVPHPMPASPVPVIQTAPARVPSTLPQQPLSSVSSSMIEAPKVPYAPPPPPPPVNMEKEFIDAHLGEIRALLVKNLKYPKNAQRLRMQGEVQVSFRLLSNGNVDTIEVHKSSGFELLDNDACSLIKNTASQFPKPTRTVEITVPLSYLLR